MICFLPLWTPRISCFVKVLCKGSTQRVAALVLQPKGSAFSSSHHFLLPAWSRVHVSSKDALFKVSEVEITGCLYLRKGK